MSLLQLEGVQHEPNDEVCHGYRKLQRALSKFRIREEKREGCALTERINQENTTRGKSDKSSADTVQSLSAKQDDFETAYKEQLFSHFQSIFLQQSFPRSSLITADIVTCLAHGQALAELLPFLYRPSQFGLLGHFLTNLGPDLILMLTEDELKLTLEKCAESFSEGLIRNKATAQTLSSFVQYICQKPVLSFDLVEFLLDYIVARLEREEVESILIHCITHLVTADQLAKIYKELPWTVPELIEKLPLQKQDELFFEEQNHQCKAQFLKIISVHRARSLYPQIKDILSRESSDSEEFVEALLEEEVVLTDLKLPTVLVEGVLGSNTTQKPHFYEALSEWTLDQPLRSKFVDQARREIWIDDGRYDPSTSNVYIDKKSSTKTYFKRDLIWINLQRQVQYPNHFKCAAADHTEATEEAYNSVVLGVRNAVNAALHETQLSRIGQLIVEYLFHDLDFSGNNLSPDIDSWTPVDVSRWWHEAMPEDLLPTSWIIQECDIGGTDLLTLDASLLNHLKLEPHKVERILAEIDKLKWKNDSTWEQFSTQTPSPHDEEWRKKPVRKWFNGDVVSWWKACLPMRAQKHVRAVRECNFTGKDLRVLDEGVLQTLGVKKIIRFKVLKAVEKLLKDRNRNSPPTSRTPSEKAEPVYTTRGEPGIKEARRSSLMVTSSTRCTKATEAPRSHSAPILNQAQLAGLDFSKYNTGSGMDRDFFEDNSDKQCGICEKTFYIMRKKHLCNFCGRNVCHSCSKNQLPLVDDSESARACDCCFSSVQATAI